MSDQAKSNQRTEEQTKALAEAAGLIARARREAVAVLRRAGTELLPEERDVLGDDGCHGLLAPPPHPHFCFCARYKGDGNEPCINNFRDFAGPDLGTGAPRVTCGHDKEEHGI